MSSKACASCGRSDVKFYKCKHKQQRLCIGCQSEYMIVYRLRDRVSALLAYSNNDPKCSCPGCDESRIEFLTIDHINGGGCEHRRSIFNGAEGSSHQLFRWLRRNSYPPGFRVLCFNCNVTRIAGKCPVHEETEESLISQLKSIILLEFSS